MSVYYAVTVKNNTNKRKPTIQDYEEWIANAINKGMEFRQVAYELDILNRIHLHAVMMGPDKLYKKRLCYKGFHQHIDELPTHDDLLRWSMYISKCDQHIVEQTAAIQEINSGYPFITA